MATKADGAPRGWFLPGERTVFLGDSITDAGGFIAMIDASLQTASQSNPPELINLGLPSETCCGLSEPAHPFPRPDLHERLARVLTRAEPNTVFVCYGMNDAIYHPFDKQRFAKFQAGVTRLIADCRAAGTRVVLMTPPPFDPLPLAKKGELRPSTAASFSWRRPSETYDAVIKRYADWVMTLRGDERVADVIDLHTPVVDYVAEKRKNDPDFALSNDGVHLNAEGHAVLARAILKHLGFTTPIENAPRHLDLYTKRLAVMHAAWLSEVGHKRPQTKPGLPMEKARTAAAELSAQIRRGE